MLFSSLFLHTLTRQLKYLKFISDKRNVCLSWRGRKGLEYLDLLHSCAKASIFSYLYGREMLKLMVSRWPSLAVRSPLLLMWPSGDNVVLWGWSNGSLVFETGRGTVMVFLKIDTSCHIEFLHLSTRMLCKGAAPESYVSSSLQNSTYHYVRRLWYFKQMIVKMLTCVNTTVFLCVRLYLNMLTVSISQENWSS